MCGPRSIRGSFLGALKAEADTTLATLKGCRTFNSQPDAWNPDCQEWQIFA